MKMAFRTILALATAALVLWLVAFQVNEGEYAIVARFGEPVRTIDRAGLYFKWPAPVDTVLRVDRRMHVLDPRPNEYLTSDKKNVIVDSMMAWTVEDPLKFWTSVGSRGGAEARLTDLMRSVVGDVLSSHPFAVLVSTEAGALDVIGLGERITEVLGRAAGESFGVKVQLARIKRLNYPAQNKDAVFRRMEQERESIAQGIRSEGVEQYEKVKADTDREEAELLSDAQRKAQELKGEADAAATRIYAEAYARNPGLYRFLRSLETLDKVLGDDATLILPADHALLEALSGPPAAEPAGPPAKEAGDG